MFRKNIKKKKEKWAKIKLRNITGWYWREWEKLCETTQEWVEDNESHSQKKVFSVQKVEAEWWEKLNISHNGKRIAKNFH